MDRLSVWVLSSELADEVPGGIARYVANFTPLLARAGHSVTIIARAKQDYDRQVEPNLRVIGFEPRYKFLAEGGEYESPDQHPAYPYNVIGYAQALSYEMAQRVLALLQTEPAPDIIESQEFSGLPYYLLQRKLTERTPLERIPILLHMHGPLYELAEANHEPRYCLPDYWTGQMEKFCARAADAVLSPSQFLAKLTASKLGITPTQIPYPVGCEPPCEPAPGTPGEILYVGRIQLLKGILPLLEACSRLWTSGRDFRLTLVGGDTQFTARRCGMQDYVRRRFSKYLESGRLVMTGPLPRDEVRERMRTAWAVVIPSLWENFPLVCIEAMSRGQLVLVSRTGGHAEMVEEDGKYGFIFDWEGKSSLQDRLETVLDMPADQRLAVVKRAQQRIGSFCSAEEVVARRVEHYRKVIRDHQPKAMFPAAPHSRAVPSAPPSYPSFSRGPDETPGLLSVVVPYYNMGKYVRDNIESVRRSTYRPIEIVVVNDGSTDPDSLRTLTELEAEGGDPPVRVVHTDNQGLASTRNNGADAARGEFVCFLDADDCVQPKYFERCIEVMKRYSNVGFVYPWLRYFGESSQIWPTWNAELPYALGHNMAAAFSVQRRSTFLRYGRNKPGMAYALEDYEMWISLLESGVAGVSLPHLLGRYRVRKDSMLQTSNEAQQLYLHDLASRLHAGTFAEWAVDLFNLQQANGASRCWVHPGAVAVGPSDTVDELRRLYRELWDETQKLGKSWELQRSHIEELAAARDRLWEEVQEQARHRLEEEKVAAALQSQLSQANASLGASENRLAMLSQEVAQIRSRLTYRVLRRLRLLPGVPSMNGEDSGTAGG